MKERYLKLKEEFTELKAYAKNPIITLDKKVFFETAISAIDEYFTKNDLQLLFVIHKHEFEESLNEIESAINCFNRGLISRDERKMIQEFKTSRNRAFDAINII
jgi:hypothetical protein